MIGPRSLIFAPLHDAGLIVVDEEHDAAYKSEEGIRYHARDLAVVLARFTRCPVVLGSATPSAESFANTRRGRYHLLRLMNRVNDRAMAAVEVIDLRIGLAQARAAAKPADKKPDAIPMSPELVNALRENLASGGQSMVFLNRRGYHNFLQCNVCGNVIACSNCSVSMTFHLRDRSLRCHYCGNRSAAPEQCPECNELGLSGQGYGTERLQAALAELMPAARIERMDSDTSGRKGARADILAALRAGEIDVLVGTQMITKGFDFPGVTLAAVIFADASLNLPDFRSAERTFQLLTQVAGRAGRGERARARRHPDLRAASLQYPRRARAGLCALHPPRAGTAPRTFLSALREARDGAHRGRGSRGGVARRHFGGACARARGRRVSPDRVARHHSRARSRARAHRADQEALSMAGDGEV